MSGRGGRANPRMDGDRQSWRGSPTRGRGGSPARGRGGFRRDDSRTPPSSFTQTRPTTSGGTRQVQLMTNFVEIIPMKEKCIHKYRIDFAPQVETANMKKFLYRAAIRGLFEKAPIYDWAHECRSNQRLASKETTREVASDRRDDARVYTVRFTHTGTVANGPEMMRIYNMQMNQFLRNYLGFYSPQPGVYVHPDLATDIGGTDNVKDRLTIVRGYRTSANLHEDNKTLVSLEAAHKILQKENVNTLINQVRGKADARNWQLKVKRALENKIVVASYGKMLAYRVEDVNFDLNPSSTFPRGGEQITYIKYYKEQLNVGVEDLKQPLLRVVRSNRRARDAEGQASETYLVPELCNIAGLTDTQKESRSIKFKLIEESQIEPKGRIDQAKEFLKKFHDNAGVRNELTSWGYDYGRELFSVSARVIPVARYATNNGNPNDMTQWPTADSRTANIQNVRELAVSPKIRKIAFITTKEDSKIKTTIWEILKSGFNDVGLEVAEPQRIDLQGGTRESNYTRAIKQVTPDTEIAIVILSKQNKIFYDAIKKEASLERGLITQCVTARLMMAGESKVKAASQKIAIQIAAKVGGEPWWCDIGHKNVMVCGYDAHHDTNARMTSFGAFVASLNGRFSRWWSKADNHGRYEEISPHIPANMREAVNQYRKFNGHLPERVILYRDGVGEGQLGQVQQVETSRINNELKDIDENIKFTMIIVNKRIGARFYLEKVGDKKEYVNPPPGTVVDSGVTRPGRNDFFLISQYTLRGTVTPTYYNIIHDESNLSLKEHQELAFKLCFLYYNWSGTVRVPAPCQYAHKLAFLCGESLHAQPNAIMDDMLHFL